jgi:hypothetical protein
MFDTFGEKWSHWNNLDGTNLVERYCAGQLALHLHMRVDVMESVQTCAVFKHIPGSGPQDQIPIFPVGEDYPTVIPNPEVYGYDSMLVGIIEILQHPQGVLVCGTPSMVRLHLLDDCLNVGGRSFYHGGRSGFVALGSLKDGELRFSRGLLIIDPEKLTNEMVESGTKLICNFTGEQDQLDRWISEARLLGKESNYSSLEITLYSNGIRARMAGSRFTDKAIEVLFGPFNLGMDTI